MPSIRSSFFWLLLLAGCLNAQSKITISGTITDAEDGEFLISANVYITKHKIGTGTNQYGFYSITFPYTDSVGLTISYLGYEHQVKKVYATKNIVLNVELTPHASALDEIVVAGEEPDRNVSTTEMSVLDIPTAKIKELPAILGEPDVLKILQLLPGVASGNEGTTGFFVRGGAADQNLVLLDEAPIYNPNHLVGLVSAFNSRAINKVTLVKGGFPSQYGGRLSSILDISMKEGDRKKFSGEGGIGLISSQLTLEGPIKKDVSSFIVSGRRTYFDWLIKPFLPKKLQTNYVFYDLNTKLNYQLSSKDRIYVSGFMSKDDAFYSQDGIEYNLLIDNKSAILRWNHIFSPKLFSNTSLILSKFNQDISALQDNAFSNVISGIQDLAGKIEFQYFPDPNNTIRFGVQYQSHTFKSSGDSRVFSGTGKNLKTQAALIPKKEIDEIALYVNDEITIDESFSANIGLRLPGFVAKEFNYYRLEPRISLRYSFNPSASVKASYSLMNQFVHQVPSSASAIPTDIWVPSTKRTKPQTSQQYALGVFKNFKQNQIESSIEFYYKTMSDQILFREGNQLIKSLDVDNLLVYGKGWSYGAELLLKKNSGRFTGWAAYTLSWTYQQFDELNFGKKFPFRYDRRHDLSLVGTFELNEKWSFSGTFVLSSGSAYTVPVGRIPIANGGSLFEGNYYLYDERNNARLNPYHRFNLSVIRKKETRFLGHKYVGEWAFSIYNVYNRQNPYFVFFDINPVTDKPKAVQVSLVPIVPSISYNFKF